MGWPTRLLLVAVVAAGVLVVGLAGLTMVRWRASAEVPALPPDVVLTVTPVPTVPRAPAPTARPMQQAGSPELALRVDRAMRGVVQVRTPRGLGTGFVWVRDASRTLVVTAAHVVAGYGQVQVVAPDGTAHTAFVSVQDALRDVAVLQAPAILGVEALPRGQSRALALGSALTAVGYAAGAQLVGEPTVTRGILSGRRTFEGIEFLQTDAALNPGVSGGPLLDDRGAVVGMAVGALAWIGELPAQNLNFAVTIEEIELVVSR